MSNWSIKTAPTHFPTAVATNSGWVHPTTGEVLVCLKGLPAKRADANTLPTFTLAVPANASYVVGNVLTFTVTASEGVNVSGIPSINVTLSTGGTVQAVYDATSSTSTSLVFKYTIVAGNKAVAGITVANTMNFNTPGKRKSKIVDQIASGSGSVVPDANVTFTVPTTTGILIP